jgi:NAD(P)-dependent dehydrogenase (short-subunit alcohol dehydrogenase family)
MTEERGALQERVVIVTGGTGGIGRATCEAAAAEGASLVVADLVAARAEALAKELPGRPGSAMGHLGLGMDVRRPADNEELARATLDRFGRIDALVTCAGVLRGPGQSPRPIVDVTPEEWDYVVDCNLKGVFLSNRAVLPTMVGQRAGTIVNVSSVQGLVGRAHDGPYCASKFGVIGLSQAIAEEVKRFGVKVIPIMPHAVDTPMWDQNGPVPRPANALPPQRIADLILFILTQPEDSVLTGAVVAPLGARRRKRADDGSVPGGGTGADRTG